MLERGALEAQRQQVLRFLSEQDDVNSGRYWNSEEIAQGTGLSMKDVEYHLDVLDDGNYADVLKTGGEHYAAMIRPSGKRLYREGVDSGRFSVTTNIGALINQMSGGNVNAVGSAIESEVSQTVNDPAMLKAALDELGDRLREAVSSELRAADLEDYTRAIEDLKTELADRRDSGRVRRLLRTLALFGDIEGTLGLIGRVAPLVGTAAVLAQGMGLG
jgi:DNA-binding transcriptional ArsR family regulator